MLTRITTLLPTQTRRSEESESLQQFSTPIGWAFVASVAARLRLRTSCWNHRLARAFSPSSLVLPSSLIRSARETQFDAAHINDRLDAGIVPSVVLMNLPFSAAIHVDRKTADAALRHIGSALARLPEGGRLITVAGANAAPVRLYDAIPPV
jgi:hypothetical protein